MGRQEIPMLKEALVTDDGELNPLAMDELHEALAAMPPVSERFTGSEYTTPRWFLVKEIIGYFAMWAVRQSPYVCPDGLPQVLVDLHGRIVGLFDRNGMAQLSLRDIGKLIEDNALTLPQVKLWNERKNGGDQIGIVSRYGGEPDPDNDFIDLGALASNVVVGLRNDRRESDRFDAKFEREQQEAQS